MSQRRRARQGRRARAVPEPQATAAPMRIRPIVLAAGAAIVLAAFGLYTATAARDIVFGDTPELTGVAITLGVAHPPGYPLWTMIAWAFGQIPLGTPPFRIAMLSVVSHAATVGVTYAATYRFARSLPAAAVAAMALASEPLFWSWSLVGEVFPLADLLAATLLFLVALWHEHPERTRLLIAAGLVGGLGMAHHQTIVLVAPAVLYVLWRRRRSLLRTPRLLVRTGAAFAVGLLPYLELLVAASRRPSWSWGDLQTPGDLVAHVLRLSYGTTSLSAEPSLLGGSVVERIGAFVATFDLLQWTLLVGGAVYAWRTMRWYATYLLIAFAVAGPAFVAYSNANVSQEFGLAILERFFLLPRTAIAPLAGFAVLGAATLAARVRLPQRILVGAAAGIAIAVALALVPVRYAETDQSDNHWARIVAEDILGTLKPDTVLFAYGDPVVFPVWYLQRNEGARHDVVTVGASLIGERWYIRELRAVRPDVVVSDDWYGPGGATFRSFIEPNLRRRPIAEIGDFSDTSTGVYGVFPRGLTYEIRATQTFVLQDLDTENAEIMARYRPPRPEQVTGPHRRWERGPLTDYAATYLRVGRQYEVAADGLRSTDPKGAAELYGRAKSWYERALAVNPAFPPVKEAIARVSR